MQTRNAPYLPAIDHLRAFAALLMTAFHGFKFFRFSLSPSNTDSFLETRNPFLIMITEGHTAVALFMTLSGFILTYIGYEKAVSYSGYILNRILRIFPLFLALLLVGFHSKPFVGADFDKVLATIFMLSNSKMGLDAAPFTTMFWTIAVEFQFYLIFPWLLTFLEKDGPKALWKWIAFFFLMRIYIYLATGNTLIAYWTLVGRIDQFCIGMIAARYFILYKEVLSKYAMPLIIFSGAGVLGLMGLLHQFNGFNEGPYRIGFHTLEAVAWAGFLLGYLFVAEKWPSKISSVFCFLGSISYSIYLTHYIVISLLCQKGWILPWGSSVIVQSVINTFFVATPLIVLSSTLSYYAVEKPFLDLRRRYVKA